MRALPVHIILSLEVCVFLPPVLIVKFIYTYAREPMKVVANYVRDVLQYSTFVRRRLVCLPGFAKNQAVNTRWYRNPWSSRRRQSTYSSKIGLLLTVRSKFEDFYFIFNFHTVQDARYTVLFSEIRTAHGGRTLQLASS